MQLYKDWSHHHHHRLFLQPHPLQRHPRHPRVLAPALLTNYLLLDPSESVGGSPAGERNNKGNIVVHHVILLPPVLVVSATTKKHTLVSFNRVIFVASDQISSLVLCLGKVITIDAKEEMKQEQQ